MIHIERGATPAIFRSEAMRRFRRAAESFFAVSAEDRKRKQFPFEPLTKQEAVIAALRQRFHGKCAYCERPLDEKGPGFMDTFRPKQRAVGKDGSISMDHYWWLAYEWTNLVACCLTCNRLKGSRFPIQGRRARPGAGPEELARERPLLLDPCLDDPEEHLVFDASGHVASETERGRVTIEVLGLNRQELVELREQTARDLDKLWEVDPHHTLLKPDLPFLALRRQLLDQWPHERKTIGSVLRGGTLNFGSDKVAAVFETYRDHLELRESFSVEDDGRKDDYYLKARLIERLEIRNFKGIRDLKLSLLGSQADGPCLLLLGENGTGKSSILQAVALALMGREHQDRLAGLDASSYVADGEEEGSVRVHLTGNLEPVELRFRRGSPRFEIRPEDPKVLLLGYGATRLLPRPGTVPVTRFGASKTDNLFNPFVPLDDANAWFCGLPAEELARVERSLQKLLLLGDDVRFFAEPGDPPVVHVEAYGARVSLDRLSDGYQSIVALAADIMSVLRLRWTEMDLAEGIVLIDEIDAHLHPRWKMQVVQRLREVFPRLQFLMTSHDPLCLRGFKAGEVAVMRRDAEGRVSVLTDLPSPEGLRVDQILTSEFFGLNSTRSPEDDQLFEEYYQLLAVRRPAAKQKARLAELKAQLEGRDLLGTTRRERLVLEAADRFLAREAAETDAGVRSQLKEETRQKIADLWESVPPAARPPE